MRSSAHRLALTSNRPLSLATDGSATIFPDSRYANQSLSPNTACARPRSSGAESAIHNRREAVNKGAREVSGALMKLAPAFARQLKALQRAAPVPRRGRKQHFSFGIHHYRPMAHACGRDRQDILGPRSNRSSPIKYCATNFLSVRKV